MAQKKAAGKEYEIVVIGGGPGGYVAAIKAAQMGKSAALVEREFVGGTCLNVGCIPTKALLRSVEALKEVRDCAAYGVTGVTAASARLDMKAVQKRKNAIVGQLTNGVKGLLRANGVDVYDGEGVLKDPHTIAVGKETIKADNVIIATGSETKYLSIPTDPRMKVLSSREMLDITKIPAAVTVIGGGVIGIEFASFLAGAGSDVTVVEFLDRILPMIDGEIGALAAKRLEKDGIKLHTSAKVVEIKKDAVVFEKDGKENSVKADMVLMAVGRVPNLSGIDVRALGIETDKDAILTDNTLRTSVDNIYAIGDVNGKYMLAHTASEEGIVAVNNICGITSCMDYSNIPSAVYIQPEIASAGLTEEEAEKQFGSVHVGRFPMIASGKAKVEGDDSGLVKVIAEARFGEIVGVHMYCPHATEMIAESVLGMRLECTAEEVADACHPHPSISEAVQEAMRAAGGKAIHFL